MEVPVVTPGEILELVDLVHEGAGSEGGVLHRMATVLSRLEDLSHVLVWARPSEEDAMATEGVDVAHRIVLVELPRLKVPLEPAAAYPTLPYPTHNRKPDRNTS